MNVGELWKKYKLLIVAVLTLGAGYVGYTMDCHHELGEALFQTTRPTGTAPAQ